jgi:Na+/H+ antiporter NhaD/arsenite permease-like protein
LVLIAFRNLSHFRIRIWQIMLGGAFAVVITGEIGLGNALHAINADVMWFLFGVFVLGEAICLSGSLMPFSHHLFSKVMSIDGLVLTLLFSIGLFSALLMNDTVAILGTPFVIAIARRYGISTEMLLLTLAFAVTTGSVMSPIGNPQNLLIALAGDFNNPFLSFFAGLAIPTIIALLVCFCILKWRYPREFEKCLLKPIPVAVMDRALGRLAGCALGLMVLLILVRVAATMFGMGPLVPLAGIALAACLPILLISPRRFEILRGVDWSTLVFFIALFVLMQSVWDTGLFQVILPGNSEVMTSVPVIMIAGVVGSQLISNVPFVALALPLLTGTGVGENGLLALAAGSTLAGNLLIFGAASNVIIVQNAEREGETLDFFAFARAGIPLTIIQTAIFWLYLGGMS